MENKGQGSMNNLDLPHLIRVCEDDILKGYGGISNQYLTPVIILPILHRLTAAEKRVMELEAAAKACFGSREQGWVICETPPQSGSDSLVNRHDLNRERFSTFLAVLRQEAP